MKSLPLQNRAWLLKTILALFYSSMLHNITKNMILLYAVTADGKTVWGDAFLAALDFRVGHYFICYLSTATAMAAGIGANAEGRWTLQVSEPFNVEVPRSLTEVVKAWNIPMHNWLKKCKVLSLHLRAVQVIPEVPEFFQIASNQHVPRAVPWLPSSSHTS